MLVAEAQANETFKEYLEHQPKLLRIIEYLDGHKQRLWKCKNNAVLDTVDKEENVVDEQFIELNQLNDILTYIDTELKPKDLTIE